MNYLCDLETCDLRFVSQKSIFTCPQKNFRHESIYNKNKGKWVEQNDEMGHLIRLKSGSSNLTTKDILQSLNAPLIFKITNKFKNGLKKSTNDLKMTPIICL